MLQWQRMNLYSYEIKNNNNYKIRDYYVPLRCLIFIIVNTKVYYSYVLEILYYWISQNEIG